MAAPSDDSKRRELAPGGALHPHAAQVTDPLFAREPFIVDDDRPELLAVGHGGQAGILAGIASSGMTIRAHVPPPGTLSSWS